MALSEITKITGPGIHTLSNVLSHNIKSSGIITATKFVGPIEGSITATDATFSGNVSIAGTLTYEDVTNIDSVGIITAPAVDVDDFLDVGSNIKLGNAGVITATSFVGSGAALTGIDATSIKDSGGNVKIQAQASGAIHSGVSTFQDIDVDGHTELDNTNIVGIVTVTNSSSGVGLKLIDASSKQFVAGGGGGGTPFAGSFTGHDFRIQVGGLQNAIFKYASGATGNLELGPSSGIGITFNGATGNAGYAGIVTASQGLRVPNGSATSNYISVGNNGALRIWGTTHQYTDIRSGNLHFRNASLDNVLEIQQDKDVWMYGATYTLGAARFDSTVTMADSLIHFGDTDTKIRFPSNDTISFETGGTQAAQIDSSQRLTIGTGGVGNASVYADDIVIDGAGARGITIHTTSTSGSRPGCIFFGEGTSVPDYASGIIMYEHNGDFMHFSTGSGTALGKSLRINSVGDVRFDSTPTSAHAMSVIIKSHKSRVVDDNNGICFLDGGDHTQAVINVQKKNASNATSDLVFRTSSGQVVNTLQGIPERLRIKSTGQTMIGDSTVGNSTNEKLIIQGMVTNANYEASIALRRGTTISSGDAGLGYIKFQDSAGSTGASMGGRADNTWSGSSRPTHLLFYTTPSGSNSSSERMRVHSDGYVTKPYNPAFIANGGNNGRTILPASTKVTFNAVNNSNSYIAFNGNSRNSGYSTSNSRFTAPVTGTYHFTVAIYFYGDNAGNICSIVPRVNGNEIHNGNDHVFFFSHDHNGANNQDGFTQSGSITLNLAANDYVEVWRRAGNTGNHYYYTGHSHFCGYLVG